MSLEAHAPAASHASQLLLWVFQKKKKKKNVRFKVALAGFLSCREIFVFCVCLLPPPPMNKIDVTYSWDFCLCHKVGGAWAVVIADGVYTGTTSGRQG